MAALHERLHFDTEHRWVLDSSRRYMLPLRGPARFPFARRTAGIAHPKEMKP
jgi:hypothetical protein